MKKPVHEINPPLDFDYVSQGQQSHSSLIKGCKFYSKDFDIIHLTISMLKGMGINPRLFFTNSTEKEGMFVCLIPNRKEIKKLDRHWATKEWLFPMGEKGFVTLGTVYKNSFNLCDWVEVSLDGSESEIQTTIQTIIDIHLFSVKNNRWVRKTSSDVVDYQFVG